MNSAPSPLVDAVAKICAKYDDAYWYARDNDHRFPEEFVRDIAVGGFLGVAMPESVGGAGLGVGDAALMMHEIAHSGAGMSGVSAVHINIFGPHPIAVFGSEAQKIRMLRPLIEGRTRCCFAVTEPDAGLDTSSIKTRAERDGDHWLVNGRKIWTSTAQSATHMLLLARTAPKGPRATDGLSLFYTALDRARVEVREIPKMGRHAVDSNMLFIDALRVPADDLIGEAGKGFDYLLHAFNPERILVAAEAVGIGERGVLFEDAAIDAAAKVFQEVAVDLRIDIGDYTFGVDLDSRAGGSRLGAGYPGGGDDGCGHHGGGEGAAGDFGSGFHIDYATLQQMADSRGGRGRRCSTKTP